MNIGFGYFRYLYAPSGFTKFAGIQSIYGFVVPLLILLLCSQILNERDGKFANWNFMFLILFNTIFTIIDRFLGQFRFSPSWIFKYRMITCFVTYVVLITVVISYTRKLRGWNSKKLMINYKPDNEEERILYEENAITNKLLDNNEPPTDIVIHKKNKKEKLKVVRKIE